MIAFALRGSAVPLMIRPESGGGPQGGVHA
jgi:hypothetical protein